MSYQVEQELQGCIPSSLQYTLAQQHSGPVQVPPPSASPPRAAHPHNHPTARPSCPQPNPMHVNHERLAVPQLTLAVIVRHTAHAVHIVLLPLQPPLPLLLILVRLPQLRLSQLSVHVVDVRAIVCKVSSQVARLAARPPLPRPRPCRTAVGHRPQRRQRWRRRQRRKGRGCGGCAAGAAAAAAGGAAAHGSAGSGVPVPPVVVDACKRGHEFSSSETGVPKARPSTEYRLSRAQQELRPQHMTGLRLLAAAALTRQRSYVETNQPTADRAAQHNPHP